MNDATGGINFCAGMAPSWAEEVRHPDLRSTEYWHRVAVVHSSDFHDELAIGVVQNGPGADVQISVAGIRFTVSEAREVADALAEALDVADGEDGSASASPRTRSTQ